MSNFQGIQGSGGDVYQGPYTWGGSGPRIIANLHGASPAGKFKARDDYDGAWLEVEAGEMVPLTEELRAAKDNKLVASRAELRVLLKQCQSLIIAIDALLR